jgi:tetratricopeptide (TPR) repeat protein
MKMMKINSAIGTIALALAATIFGAATIQAQAAAQTPAPSTQGQQPAPNGQPAAGQNGQGRGGRGPTIDPAEEAAFKAFNTATDNDAKITAGESFEQKYPNSHYLETVQATLVNLYYAKQDWTKFYAEADKTIAKDPDNVPVLTLVGWVIPRVYKADDPAEPAKLDESEKYEKHALDLIASMQKPAQLSDDQFNQAKASAASEAHSGLGMTYFRRNDFDNSAKELSTATTEAAADVDPADLYILGVDYQKLNRNTDAADAFNKCGQIPGSLQDRCKQSATTLQGSSLAPAGGSK